MKPRERILKAMNLEKHDRVPVMCQFSIGFMNQQLKETGITPMELWNDANRYAEALVWLLETFKFDGILVSLHGFDPNWREKINKLEIVEGIEKAEFGDRIEKYIDNDLPVGKFFKSREKKIEDVDPDEIPERLDYIPASKGCYIFLNDSAPYRIFDILAEKTKGNYSLHGEVTSPLDYLLDLLGYENGLMAMITHTEKVEKILEKFASGVIKMASDIASHKNVDAVKISSPFAGMGFISPDFYRKFEIPYLARISDAVKAQGKYSYVHTCGSINDRLELMEESGVSGLECLDPPPIGNVELEDAFDRIGGKMFIKGNIDSVNTLLNGTEQSIRDDIKNRMNLGKKNKGFILSTACSIAPKVPRENVQLLAKIVKEFGVYK
ncbi:MAG: uroporphyrinogen decarboxylase family protein [Acidobacteriota bacterium]